MATASTAFTARDRGSSGQERSSIERLIFGKRRQALQSSRHRPIHAVTPAMAGNRNVEIRSPPHSQDRHQDQRRAVNWRFCVVPPQRTTARLRAGFPHSGGAPNMPANRYWRCRKLRVRHPASKSSWACAVRWKCSTTREVIRIFTEETKARPKAEGSTVKISVGLHEKPKIGERGGQIRPTSFSCMPKRRASRIAKRDAQQGRGQAVGERATRWPPR